MPNDLQLHPGVSFCRVSDTLVFLDITQDRYFCFKGDQSDWFEEIIRTRQPESLGKKASAFREHLIRKSMLTCSPGQGGGITACKHQAASTSLLDDGVNGTPGPKDSLRFFATWLTCAATRRKPGIQILLEDTRRRKARLQMPPMTDDAARLASAFHALAPYVMTLHDACLFRSYILIRYLASAGIPADWIFGVRLAPFSAHCWVEYQGRVLNEHLDTVMEFQPILLA